MADGKVGAPKGNRNSAKTRIFTNTLLDLIKNEELTLPENKRRLRMCAGKLLSKAAAGEAWAVKELANRIEGKAIQGVELSGPGGSAVNFFDPAMMRNLSPGELDKLKELLGKAAVGIPDEEYPGE